jgi:hypothetical protein
MLVSSGDSSRGHPILMLGGAPKAHEVFSKCPGGTGDRAGTTYPYSLQPFRASDPVGIASCIRDTAAAVSSLDKKRARDKPSPRARS